MILMPLTGHPPKRDVPNGLLMARKAGQFVTVDRMPEAHGLVVGTGHEHLPIRRISETGHPKPMSFDPRKFNTAGRVPATSRPARSLLD